MQLKDFVGKEVQIYPEDAYSKFGIIEEISDKGFLIKITSSRAEECDVGDILFISHSVGLKFKKNIGL